MFRRMRPALYVWGEVTMSSAILCPDPSSRHTYVDSTGTILRLTVVGAGFGRGGGGVARRALWRLCLAGFVADFFLLLSPLASPITAKMISRRTTPAASSVPGPKAGGPPPPRSRSRRAGGTYA